ncbi:calmodulin regulator protein PCP4a isoform X1 [Antennarius striatus]|uniref:calmodulin regulator protein PCP4a isoform X1 n=1 Tax=Antennarius striatus TaxID=241820 RepID=UPI0035AF46C3
MRARCASQREDRSSWGHITDHWQPAPTDPTRRAAMSERQASGAMTEKSKPSAGQGLHGQQKEAAKHEKKCSLPQDFDIDMENPETEKAAVAIQSQFRKFQKKKQDAKS